MKTAIWITLFMLAASNAKALEFCKATETIGDCFNRADEQREQANGKQRLAETQAVKTEANSEQWQRLASKATGPDVPEQGLESATEDFLPTLRFALALAGIQDGLDSSALNFEQKIGTFGLDNSLELKAKGTVNDADVFAPLKMAFGDDIRDQRVATLKQELDDFDDYSVTLSANLGNEQFGRTPNRYSQKAFQALFDHAVKSADAAFAPSDAAGFAFLATLKTIRTIQGTPATLETSFNDLSAGDADLLEKSALELAHATVSLIDSLKETANSLEIFRVADLLNNQPQINFSGTYRLRDGAAGPDELTIKASYEHGFANLNALRRRCGEPSADSAVFATCYGQFMDDATAALEKGDRLSISAEYTQTDSFRFAVPADDINLNLKPESGLVITTAYARYLPSLGDNESRIDLTGKYESQDDRGVVTAIYTNRALKALGGSIGISYANHEKYLPESDHVIGAHMGLSFKSFSKNAPEKTTTP